MFQSLNPVTQGDFAALPAILQELQGLTTVVLDGAASDTKINLAAIRTEDTITSAIMFASGVPSDVKANASIVDTRASGTLTLSGVVANDTVAVAGKTFTFKATPNPLNLEVAVGASDTLSAANLAAAINRFLGNSVSATSASAVVTVRANADGTTGNSITTVGSTHITASGATLSGGTATGGVKFNTNTTGNKIVLTYFNKK